MLRRQIHGEKDGTAYATRDIEILLKYTARNETTEEDFLLSGEKTQFPDYSNLEDILKEHENKRLEIGKKDPDASELFNSFLEEVVKDDKKVGIIFYEQEEKEGYVDEDAGKMYVVEDKDDDDFNYLFVPRGISVHRVSQNILGPNVLGRTWLGSNYIEVLDTLYGDAFQEVLLHEVNHLLYPHEDEMEIRARTRMQLTSPIYH